LTPQASLFVSQGSGELPAFLEVTSPRSYQQAMLEHATPVPPSNPANVDTIHARGGTLDEHLATTAAAAKADARTAMTVGSMSLAATNIAGMATAVSLVPGGQIIGLGMTAVSSLTDAKSSMNASRRADALRDVKARTPRLSCDNPGQGHDRWPTGSCLTPSIKWTNGPKGKSSPPSPSWARSWRLFMEREGERPGMRRTCGP
jgi:hypothetical protein